MPSSSDTSDSSQSAADVIAAFNQQLLESVFRPLMQPGQSSGSMDSAAMLRLMAEDYARDPQRWQEMQQRWYAQQLDLWARMARPAQVDTASTENNAQLQDRRFRAPEWRAPWFDWLAQSYLISSQWLTDMAAGTKLDAQAQKKVAFHVRQYVDAVAPSNFVWSNPEALKLATETAGASLAQGMENLRADMDKGMVSMTDESAFEVGRNLATTPGAVVYENGIMQLIQYRPTTPDVHALPLVMVPPCINKFYILDLQPDNSLVRHALDQGQTVFMVSWRNVPESMGHVTWDAYLEDGIIRALDTARAICGTKKVNVLGFCVGGTLVAAALAVLRAKKKNPVASLTLLATMLDFSDTGELSVFVDEPYVCEREKQLAQGGEQGSLLRGRELAITFASLRANDLIWNYVVNNYLKGKTPEPFDLLYWNSDSTNLPGAMYAYYVRNTYLENNLRKPGKLTMCGVPVDLGTLDIPVYLLATREDHIVPWKTAYTSTQLLRGDLTFVLAASGHIAGVINSAARNRRNYWVNDNLAENPDDWLAAATAQPGSWWTHWSAWLARHAGARTAARTTLGSKGHPEIEPAPGRYVREKSDKSA